MANLFRKNCVFFLGLCITTHYCFGQVENVSDGSEAVGSTAQEVVAATELGDGHVQTAAGQVVRDPFLPIGYKPKRQTPEPKVETAQESEIDEALDLAGLSEEERAVIKQRMKIGGILQQRSGIMVIINNQLVKQGEQVTLESDVRSYDFLVKKLTPDRIVLESLQKDLAVH